MVLVLPFTLMLLLFRSLIHRQFDDYVTGVRKADCAADLKRRIGERESKTRPAKLFVSLRSLMHSLLHSL